MARFTIIAFAAFLMATSAMAQLSTAYSEWGAGPVQHLMTKDELNKWKSIKTDEEAQAFVDLFWARRDPDLKSPRNTFREEFEARVAAADDQFTTMKTRGAMSDRGRALILLGPPFQAASRGAEMRAGAMRTPNPGGLGGDGTVNVQSARPQSATITWEYGGDKKPSFINRRNFDLVFVDDSGNGDYMLAITPRSNPEVFFSQAVNHYILSPKLTAVPAHAAPTTIAAPARATSFRNEALRQAWEEFRAAGQPSLGSIHLTWGEYVTPAGQTFVPVQLYASADSGIAAGTNVTFFGVIESSSGEVVEVLEESTTMVKSGRDAFVARSLELEPGQYNATFGLARGAEPLAITKAKISVEGLDESAPGISQLILSSDVYPLPEAQRMTDPYAFGGLKVVPKSDGVFAQSDELYYFFELRNPGLTDAGTPNLMVKIDIEGIGGTPGKWALPIQKAETLPLKGVDGHHMHFLAFPLEGFSAGEYQLKLRLVDSVLQKEYEFERTFRVREL